jgi:DNA-binding NarL/FixJ family response regulator
MRRLERLGMPRPRVLLADDHRMLREAFAQLLESSCEIVGAVGDGQALLLAAEQLRPDIVVADIGMPLLNGLDAARQLKRSMPDVKIVILTVTEDPDVAAEAFRAGASSFLLKNSAASELLRAIEEAMHGRSYVTPLVAKGLVNSLAKSGHAAHKKHVTSLRQREVLQLLAEGRTMKEVARILKIKPRTVAFHKYGMMKQLGIKTTAELVQFAVRQGVVGN